MVVAVERVCAWDSLPNPQYNLWTIGNSSEVVPGISTPFISTTGQEFEADSARIVVEQLGLGDLVTVYGAPVGNWAAVIAGRWALNLAWFNAVIGSWQVEGPSGLMEQFISSTDGHDITAQALDDPERVQRTWRKVRRIRAGLERAVARDRERIEALREQERGRDLAAMSDKQIWRLGLRLRRVCAALLARHLHVSLSAGDYTDRLNKLLDAALPGHDPALVIALTSALRNVESAAPAKGAWDVAQSIKRRKGLLAEVQELSPNAIAERLRNPEGAAWKAFAEQFRAFIAQFGFRGMGEVDPAYADWEEEPAFALSSIKAYLDQPKERSPYVLEERTAQAREAIEAQIEPAIPRDQRRRYKELLAGAQTFTRLRESSKANWVRGDRTLRRPMLELGRRFVERGRIAPAGDIFWMTEPEVRAAIERTAEGATDLRAVVGQRKQQAATLNEMELPEVFPLPVTPAPKATPTIDGAVLQGMPVSAGVASGRARVVLSTESALEVELEPGEILIAPFTDAPWTPLFVPAAAVVVETGGILSHAATVAREFGIPAVVAVKGATRLIKTGQQITVDGMSGTVTVG